MSSHESPFDEEFDKLVKTELEKWKVPGLSIAIVQDSEISAKAYGLAELPSGTHAPRPMTTDALFAACSTTKAFTSAATAIAIRDSQDTKSPMSWSTTLASLIPGDFVLEDEHATQNVTLEDALSHRTGMPQHNWTLAFFKSKGATPASTVRVMRYMPLATPLRSKYHYSNHMYIAVSHALEQRTGIPLGTCMKNRIWKPLGMNDTYFRAAEAKEDPSSAARFVQGYDWIPAENGDSFETRPEHDWPSNSGAGAIHSNVTDYARWVKELIDPTGPLKGHDTLIKPRTICLEDEDADLPAPFHGYALGWAVDNYRGQYLYSHGGGWPGYASHVGFVPSKRFGWVIMGNSSSARYAAFRIFTFILDKHLNLPADPDYQDQIAAIIAKQESMWQTKLANETPELSKQRLFPRLPDPPILHTLPLIKYTGTYLHRSEAMIDLRIESGCLVADLQDRVIPCELSISHASGEFFIGRIYRTGLDLLPPFIVEFCLDSAGTVTKMGLLIEPDINEQKIWFERLGI